MTIQNDQIIRVKHNPEGKPDVQWFNVGNITILDKNSKTIQVDFNESSVRILQKTYNL